MKSIKCPSCGAPLTYNLGSKILKCDYCGTEYPQEEYTDVLNEGIDLNLEKNIKVKEAHEKSRPKLKRRRSREEIGCALFIPLLIAAGFLPIIIAFIAFIFGCDNWTDVWIISTGILWTIFLGFCLATFFKPRI